MRQIIYFLRMLCLVKVRKKHSHSILITLIILLNDSKAGVLQRDNAQHPAVIRWLIDNDPDTLKNNIMALLSQTGSQRVVSLLMLMQNDFTTYVRLRYRRFLCQMNIY